MNAKNGYNQVLKLSVALKVCSCKSSYETFCEAVTTVEYSLLSWCYSLKQNLKPYKGLELLKKSIKDCNYVSVKRLKA